MKVNDKVKNVESDPSGLDQHEAGAKFDNGKVRPYLVCSGFPDALNEVYKNGTFGANKYSEFGWKSVENGKARYLDAGMRHLCKFMQGERRDEESGTHHLAAVAWNMLAACQFDLEEDGKE